MRPTAGVALPCVLALCMALAEPTCGHLHGQSRDVQALVEQLGSEEFAKRESATAALLAVGDGALLALSMAEKGKDFEVRQRARSIRQRIESDKFEALAQKFIRDNDSTASHGLPGWKTFSEIAGSSRSAKRLYLEMLDSRRIIAIALEGNAGGTVSDSVFDGLPDDAQARLAAVTASACQEIRLSLYTGGGAQLGDMLALLTAAAALKETPADLHSTIESEWNFGVLEKTKQQPALRTCIRKMLGKWFQRAPLTMAEELLSISYQYQVPEGAEIARRTLDATRDPLLKSRALMILSRFGNPADLKLIDRFVSDSTLLESFDRFDEIQEEDSKGPNPLRPLNAAPNLNVPRMLGTRRKYERQLGDVALAAGLKILDRDLQEIFPTIIIVETTGIREDSIGFRSDKPEQREAAMKLWRESRAETAPPTS